MMKNNKVIQIKVLIALLLIVGSCTAFSGCKVKTSNFHPELITTTAVAETTVKQYTVKYDYETNGGIRADKSFAVLPAHSQVDVSVKAEKPGWKFIGWTTDPDKDVTYGAINIGESNLTVYAIFQKDVVVHFINLDDSEDITIPLINNKDKAVVVPPEIPEKEGYATGGWARELPGGAIDMDPSFDITDAEDEVTFFAVYEQL